MSDGDKTDLRQAVSSFRGVNRKIVAHALNDGELCGVRNMQARDGALRTRPGLEVGYVDLDPADYWARSLFLFDLDPRALPPDDWEGPDLGDEYLGNGGISLPDDSGGSSGNAPKRFGGVNYRGAWSLYDPTPHTFGLETPATIEEDVAFVLTVTAYRKSDGGIDSFFIPRGGGGGSTAIAGYYTNGGARNGFIFSTDLVDADSGEALDLTTGWGLGQWTKSVKLVRSGEHEAAEFTFRYGLRDRARSISELLHYEYRQAENDYAAPLSAYEYQQAEN